MAIARQMKQGQPKDTNMETHQLLYISHQTAKIGVKSNLIKEIMVLGQYIYWVFEENWLTLAFHNETFAFLK